MTRVGTIAFAFSPAHISAELVIRVRKITTAVANRLAVRELNGFDERMLKDIGLTRSDVIAALDSPLSQDPSVHLRKLAFKHHRI